VDYKAEYRPIQLNQAHVARKKEPRTNRRQCSLYYRFRIRRGSPEGIRMTTEEMICEKDKF